MSRSIKNSLVYIVGAGPGEPELITVRGLRILRSADVVVHDRLIQSDLLSEARSDAEIINVGKAPGRVTTTQDQINELLIQRASHGLRVIRLKGGDPFVFGRGGEEALALRRAGVDFEIVPGISSAISAPAFAGIPLVLRGVAANFAVVTGHTVDDEKAPDWDALAKLDTVVILMGLKRRGSIAQNLIAAGRDAGTPAAIVSGGSTSGQQTASGPLGDIEQWGAGFSTPATIVVGDVVNYRPLIEWYHTEAEADTWMEAR